MKHERVLLTCRSSDDDALLFTFSQQSIIYLETETKQERRRVVGCQRENKRIYKNDSAHTGPWVSQRIWPACYLIIGPAVTERHVDKMPHLLL